MEKSREKTSLHRGPFFSYYLCFSNNYRIKNKDKDKNLKVSPNLGPIGYLFVEAMAENGSLGPPVGVSQQDC